MRGTGSGNRRLELALAAVLGVIALLALPGLAAAKARDRNHDGIPDRWEKRFHLSLRVNQAHRNQDHEGLNNLEEWEHGTNPRKADTDGDGLTDGQEVEVGDNPRSRDSNHNGIPDGQENAGEVELFAGGTLTIKLFAGGTVSGMVNESTEIQCEHPDAEAQGSEDGQDNQGEDQQDGGEAEASDTENQSESCSTANLVPGTLVKEAELDVTPEGATFHSLDLIG
jgi:hypothetical protein